MELYEVKHKYRLHTVKRGETLHTIAEKHNTTAEHIERLNKLKAPLAAGDILYIGDLDLSVYTVRPLDTIENIAQKFGANVLTLKKINNIESVYIGQRILIKQLNVKHETRNVNDYIPVSRFFGKD